VQIGSNATTSGRRLLAFRIVGWLLGVVTIVLLLPFAILALVADNPVERSHRFHVVGAFPGLILIGVFAIVFVMRPAWIAAWHVLVAQALAYLFGGLMGGDLISGFWITGLVGLVLMGVLAPDRRSLLRFPGHPSVALLTYALLCAIPAWIYAVVFAELQHGSPTDPHVELHHWSGVAVAALAIAGAGLATSLRGEGWRMASAATAIAAVAFGLAGLAFPDEPGAPDRAWSWLAVAAGIGYWLLARIEAAREAPSG
jgi:hypothetical protein